jgi:hypothetical protein
MKGKPIYYVSKVTGNKYTYDDHCNWGSGDRGKTKDLPKDEYPYLIEYAEPEKPKWQR